MCYRSSSWPPSGLPRREPRLDATVPRARVFILVPAAAKRRPERAGGDDVIDLGSSRAAPPGRARRRHVCNPVR